MALVHAEGRRRGPADVLAVAVLDLGRAVAPGLLVLVVDVPQQVVDQLGVVDQLPDLEHEHAGPLPVDQQHADRLVVVQSRLQLADGRGVIDDELAPHRHRQGEDRPEAVGRTGEHGHAAGPGPVEAALD